MRTFGRSSAYLALSLLAFILYTSTAQGSESLNLRQRFARPLILGASVSSGTFTKGPGTIATELMMGYDTSMNIARNGAEGRHFANITPENLRAYSLIISVDFMFWDSALPDVGQSRAAVRNLILSAKKARVPLVLGDVPRLHPSQVEATRTVLNHEIRSLCRRSNGCYLIGIERIHHKATHEGIVIGGYLYHFDDLSFDGIHVNEIGSRYLADILIGMLGR